MLAVVAQLDLDPLVGVDVESGRRVVAVALRYGYTRECVQARVTDDQEVEVWQLNSEELRRAPQACMARSAFGGRPGILS